MTLLVDAFNVLHAWRSAPTTGTWAEVMALARLTRRGPWASLPAIIVCDGVSPDRDRQVFELDSGVVIRFAGPDSDADSAIEALLAASNTPARVVVVSSDRRLERAAKRVGARSIRADAFIRACAAAQTSGGAPSGAAPPDRVDAEEIDHWLRTFGVPVMARPGPPTPADPDRSLIDEARIDPSELDMERWLRTNPPPADGGRGMEGRGPGD